MKECPVSCNDETIVNAFLANTKKKLKKKSIILGKLIIAWFATVFLGALLFLYIEQCARPTPKTLSDVERAWMKTCKMVANLSSEINSTQDDGETLTITSNQSVSNFNLTTTIASEFQKEMVRMCNETKVSEDVRRCVLDVNNIADYLDYTYSIAFTIGFGRIVPYSDLGKIVTMLYALPTIGLTLVVYAYGAEVLLMTSYIVTANVERRMRRRKNITVCKYKTSLIQISLAMISFLTMTLVLITDTASDRSVLDSFYLCFISVTTIGFGDLTYNSKPHLQQTPWLYVPQLVIFLLTMSIVASALSSVSDVLKKNELGKWVSRKASSNSTRKKKRSSTCYDTYDDKGTNVEVIKFKETCNGQQNGGVEDERFKSYFR